ncbi:DNA polymerase beta superfamily protein [Cellulomonas endophytica]|uniref:DNA polymerase beta superfamily protein n=1 Tax=Cellulomonas endophytica TaxID=2494735 RepID=UPI00101109E2|nr:nucleotidyltransferase domain-containing protein [Cellulomonas endophytica]
MTALDERAPVDVGDREVALANEILRTVCGSGVHGMAIAGHDDHDEMGVYVETREQVVGLAPSSHHYVSRTQPEGVRSGPGDTDLTVYALRKYMRLAVAGNPTVLTVLFAPAGSVLVETPLGTELRELAPVILSLEAGRRFLGYLVGQRERLLGGGQRSRVPNRPELVAAHGYDTKYASHALRLGYQGLEVVTEGRLTLPVDGPALAACMEVKRGEVGFDEALRRVDEVRDRLDEAIRSGRSPLRERPDRERIDAWLVGAHERHWAAAAAR